MSRRTPNNWHAHERDDARATLPLIAESAAMRQLLDTLDRFSRVAGWPVAVEGESGAGKTLVARRLHDLRRPPGSPFKQVLLNTLSAGVFASEVFGHLPGSFSGAVARRTGLIASAQGGTVFLDEIDKAPREILEKLLHLIEWGEIIPVGADTAVRIHADFIVASNRSLATLATNGLFPPDLLARIGPFVVRVPSLRERRADIPLLVEVLVAQLVSPRGDDVSVPTIEPALLRALCAADWPNNLRELKATLALLLANANGARVISLDHVSRELAFLYEQPHDRRVTDEALLDAWTRAKYNQSETARVLGIDRTTVVRRLKARAVLSPAARKPFPAAS